MPQKEPSRWTVYTPEFPFEGQMIRDAIYVHEASTPQEAFDFAAAGFAKQRSEWARLCRVNKTDYRIGITVTKHIANLHKPRPTWVMTAEGLKPLS